jgi:hypothetical protein
VSGVLSMENPIVGTTCIVRSQDEEDEESTQACALDSSAPRRRASHVRLVRDGVRGPGQDGCSNGPA